MCFSSATQRESLHCESSLSESLYCIIARWGLLNLLAFKESPGDEGMCHCGQTARNSSDPLRDWNPTEWAILPFLCWPLRDRDLTYHPGCWGYTLPCWILQALLLPFVLCSVSPSTVWELPRYWEGEGRKGRLCSNELILFLWVLLTGEKKDKRNGYGNGSGAASHSGLPGKREESMARSLRTA